MGYKLDAIDKKIIRVLREDGRTTLQEIGETVELSRISVAKRMDSLLKNEIVKVEGLLNVRKLGGIVSMIQVEVHSKEREKLIGKLKKCPRVLWVMQATGSFNLILIYWCDNNDTLSSFVEKCIRPFAEKCDMTTGSFPEYPEFVPTTYYRKKKEKAPCGETCGECEFYKKEKCSGCPATNDFKEESK